jgi:hypothetical protein
MTRLVRVERKTEVSPGYDGPPPLPFGLYLWYSAAWLGYYEPPRVYQYDVRISETSLYDVRSNQLVWSSTVQTNTPADLNKEIQRYVAAVIKALKKNNVLAASLLGQSRRAASTPVFFALTPVALVGFLAPLASGVCLPAGRRITTPPAPVLRGDRVVGDGHLEDRARDVRGLNDRPRTVPGGPNVPSIGEDPVLVCVEEDVPRRARRIVHGAALNDEESRRPRQMNADIDTDLGVDGGRECRDENREGNQHANHRSSVWVGASGQPRS